MAFTSVPTMIAAHVAINNSRRNSGSGLSSTELDEGTKRRKLLVKKTRELIQSDRLEERLKDKVYPPGAAGIRERFIDRFLG